VTDFASAAIATAALSVLELLEKRASGTISDGRSSALVPLV
jgi:hypothetical protein